MGIPYKSIGFPLVGGFVFCTENRGIIVEMEADRYVVTTISVFGHTVSICFDTESSVSSCGDFCSQVIKPLLMAQSFHPDIVKECFNV